MISPARIAAYCTLRDASRPHAELAAAVEHHRLGLTDERDRALAAEITLGTLRWRAALDHVIGWAGHRGVEAFDAEVLDLLRMSAYQLLHLDRVPASAIVHDAVELCRHEGKASASGAINAILRRISRERDRLPMPDQSDPLEYLTVTLSHPRWIAARWLERLGFETACAWMRFNNQPAPVVVRANRLTTSPEQLVDALAAVGITTEPARYAADALVVTGGHLLASPLATSGQFIVQDESSQLVAALAGVGPGEVVLDACAAPGGKTSQMAADLGPTGRLVAADLRPRRVRLLATLLKQAHADAVQIVTADLLAGGPFGAIFDCVLVDAPCSGLATLRRDPDVKWRRAESDLAGHAERQTRMLANAAAMVRPGGRLVYSTCSTEPEENDQVVDRFLACHQDFAIDRPDQSRGWLASGVSACLDQRGFLRPTPHMHGLEAFFGARLRQVGRAPAAG
ncbi:MAG: 16S rRNA (cytosine(967)-C(5))-methyltransferase RsmB [Acidobacteriota bacterium]